MQSISIHVPRVEDDYIYCRVRSRNCISIHVPRVEDDDEHSSAAMRRRYFNPRPPCGGRQLTGESKRQAVQFQSTSPVWRTTKADL